ncbi:MAG: PAS domain S-box protein [Thermoplasmatota archaeon]
MGSCANGSMLIGSIPAPCIILDDEGIIRNINDLGSDLLGYAPEQVIGRPLEEITSASNNIKKTNDREIPGKNEVVSGMDISFIGSDDRLIHCSVGISEIPEDGGRSHLFLLRDIRDRIHLEEQLRYRGAAHDRLCRNAPVGIFEFDIAELKILECNDVFLDYLGYSREELLSISPDKLLTEGSSRIFHDRISRLRKGERVPESVDYKVVCKDGSENWFQFNTRYHEISGRLEKATVAIHNINDRKAVVDALRESELRFRELTDLLPQTIFETDEKGMITYANKYGLMSTGYSEEDIRRGIQVTDLAVPKDRKRMVENISRIIEGRGTTGNEYTLVNKDGSKTPILTFSRPIIRNDGLRGLRGVLIDISELKASQEALQKSEEKFRTIVENSQIGMIILDSKFIIQYLNDSICGMLGYTAEEMIGKDFRIFLDEETRKLLADRYVRRQRGEDVPSAYQFNVMNKNGECLTIDIRSNVITDPDGNILTIAQMMDMTERMQATQALMESEMRSRAIFDYSPIGFVLSNDSNDCLTRTNQAFCRMLGYSEEEMRGKKIVDITHPDDIDEDATLLRKLKHGDIKVINREKRYIRRNGEVIWANVIITNISSDVDGFHNRLALVEDITEKKKAQQEIIDQRNRAEFYLDLLSHDIGNIHQGLYNWIEIAQGSSVKQDMRNMAVEQSWHLVKRSMKLVKNVLLLSNIRSRITDLKQVDIVPLVEKSVEDVSHIYPDRTIDFDIEKTEEQVNVIAEPIIEEAFFNVIQNAVKFQTGSSARLEISIVKSDDEKEVIVSIRDHGPGISQETKDDIFLNIKSERYNFRNGVGLYLVKELVDRYDGRIEVRDRVEGDHTKGARFDLIFDLAPSTT